MAAIVVDASACQSAVPTVKIKPTTYTISHTGLPNTLTSTQTLTLSPTQTYTPTTTTSPTPFPGLHSNGPYLSLNEQSSLSSVFYDLDGSGGQIITLPETDAGKLSPDGKWYAYVTGEMDMITSGNYQEGGVVLHVKNILNGMIRDIVGVIPKDYYTRQEQMIQSLLPEYPPDPRAGGADALDLFSATVILRDGLKAFTWSPDGMFLAFAAMIDSYSSDLYVYDIDSGKIHKLVSDKYNINYIEWSPDGQWILYWDTIPTPTYWGSSVRAVRTDGTEIRVITQFSAWVGVSYWFSDNEILGSTCGDGMGCSDLFSYNIQTDRRTLLWKKIFQGVVVDPGTKTLAIIIGDTCTESDYCVSDDELGLYIGPIYGNKKRVSEVTLYYLKPRGGSVHPFLGLDGPVVVGIRADGKVDPLRSGFRIQYSISPDFQWLALYDSNGLELFDSSDRSFYELKNTPVYSIVWNTNSDGLYYMGKGAIYYLDMNFTSPILIARCPDICKETEEFMMALAVQLASLPELQIFPPRIEKPAEGKSIWSRTTFNDRTQPGTSRYDVDIPANTDWRWDFSWCTTDGADFKKLLSPLDVEFLINGDKIDENMFRRYDHVGGSGQCRTWTTMLSGWKIGDKALLEIHYTLKEPVFDGKTEYQAGEYRQIISVVVDK